MVGGGVGLVWGRELNTATTDGFIFLIRKQTLLRSLSGHPEAGYSWVMTKPTFQNRMATMWAEHLEPAELEPSGQMFPSKFLVQFSPIKKPTTWSVQPVSPLDSVSDLRAKVRAPTSPFWGFSFQLHHLPQFYRQLCSALSMHTTRLAHMHV